MNMDELRLGLVCDRSAVVDGAGAWVDACIARTVDWWRQHCRRVTVAISISPIRMAHHSDRLPIAPDDFMPLPWLPSIAGGFHKFRSCRRVVREVERRSDVLVVQLPVTAPLALLRPQTPRVYHVYADLLAIARASHMYRGWRRIPGVTAGLLLDRLQRKLIGAPRTRVVTNGKALWEHYGRPPGRAVVSATISEREILSVPRSRPRDAPFRVLYVGYLRHEKGIDTLFAAFERLLGEIPNAELDLVGAVDSPSNDASGMVRATLERLCHKGAVRVLGPRAFGPELFQCFADADVLALPSRSEGTPRVLVEARALGCPIVATRVGGIPTSVSDGEDGLLVEPDRPDQLADAMLRIARDSQLRDRLIVNGIARARVTTVEAYARAIAEEALAACGETAASADGPTPIATSPCEVAPSR